MLYSRSENDTNLITCFTQQKYNINENNVSQQGYLCVSDI